MLAVSNAFSESFKQNDREVKMRIKVNDVTYTDSDIISFNYNAGSIVGDRFAIGSTYANSIKLTLCKIVEGLKQLDEVTPEMGIVLPNGSTEWVKLGTFIISEEVNPDRNENRTSLECTDKMIMLDDIYESKLNYPAKIRDVALEIANLAGVEVDKVSFGRLMENTIQKPIGYTFRQAIGLIAQFEAGYACFDRNGLLAIRQLEDKDYQVTPNEYFQNGLTKNELKFRPAGIQVKVSDTSEDDKVLKIGNEKGSVIRLENKVMTEQLLRLVYEKVKDINYYPYSLKWRGNPAVEVGDWLLVNDTRGNMFKVPNLSYSMEYKGGLTATSTVETVASNEVRFGYKKILDQVVELVENSIKDLDGNVIYYGVEEPPNPKEGDTWFKYVDSDTEIWVYEKVAEPDIFDWVFKISSAVDETIKEKIEQLEEDSKQQQIDIEKALTESELARKEAFDSTVISRQAERDALNALAQGDKNKTEITKLDGQQKLTNTKVEGNTANILNLQTDSEKLSLSIGKVQADVENTQTELATFEATMQGFQTTVNSDISGLKSQQTQMAEQFTTTISSIIENVNTYHSTETRIINSVPEGLQSYNRNSIATPYGFSVIGSQKQNGLLRLSDVITSNGLWTVSFLARGSQTTPVRFNVAVCDQGAQLFIINEDKKNEFKRYYLTVNVTNYSKDVYNFVSFYNFQWAYFFISEIQVEKGGIPTVFRPNTLDNVTKSEVVQLSDQITQTVNKVETVDGKVTSQQSQITQLSNNINLKVDKDNVIAQINLSPEQVLIQAKRIHLSGESLIDNAVIKSAHIQDGSITNAKIQDATIDSAKINSIDASKINAQTLQSITSNTGTLNVTGWIDIVSENKGIRGSYDYSDALDASYNTRWFDGNWFIAKRFIGFESNIHKVNKDGSKGALDYITRSYYGADHFKYRSWDAETKNILLGRVDITSNQIEISDNFNPENIQIWLRADGAGYIKRLSSSEIHTGMYNNTLKFNSTTRTHIGTMTLTNSENGVWINDNTSVGNAQMRFGRDGTGARIWSQDLYDRTSSGNSDLCITAYGTLARRTSARKYKADIITSESVIKNAKKVLELKPVSWLDKAELNRGEATSRYHGFIADEFDSIGLKEVVIYNERKEVEGLAYDRITMYHNVILSDHEDRLKRLERMLIGK